MEDIFVSYAQDTITRVILDLRNQNEERSREGSNINQQPRLYEVSHALSISTSVLLNDIQTFADRYSKFRIQNATYFDLTADELNAKIKPIKLEDSAEDSDDSVSSELEMEAQVPVDPELSKCYNCL